MALYEFKREDAERFASEQGIRAFARGDELQFTRCPYCRNATTKKYKFAINLHTGQFKCLRASCNAHGNMITLARDFNFSLGQNVDEYYNRQKRFRNMARFPRPIVRTPAVEYMESRGISKAITERYAITTQTEHDNILVFPFFDEQNQMQFVKYRKTDFDAEKDNNKEWCEADCKPILFGMDQCDTANDTLILTEGQIDSLSVAEAGLPNAVSVPTGANGFTWVPYCWDFLSKFKTLIVFGDYENGHITLLDKMQEKFNGTVKHVRPEDYKDCKDANEILRKHGKQAIRDAIQNAVIVQNPMIIKMSSVKRKSMAEMENIDTGLSKLNRILGGFFFGQLVILTGERGLGKSTMGSQFFIQAIEQGYTGFYYSGELMDWYVQDWLERQMAGAKYINTMQSNLGFTTYSVDGQYLNTIQSWYDDKLFLYSNKNLSIDDDAEEIETLPDTMLSAITQYGCRILFVDNLMTAIMDDESVDLYRKQSNFVKQLSMMAKRFNVLIILVAHPKKRNGTLFNNDDVAGSSNITNLADVVLRYDMPPQENPKEYSRMLQVTKNRLTGRVDFNGIGLYFEDSSKRISESQFDFDWEYGWTRLDPEWSEQLPDVIPF